MAASVMLYGFMLLMLCMGTLNMLMLKFQHMQLAPMTPGGEPEHFDHPWLQAGFMMVGEFLCLIAYFCTRSAQDVEVFRKTPKWIFIVPTCCDLVATALLCMGLAFVAVSVAQMCRGTVIIFVCVMSYLFLNRSQKPHQLTGVALVLLGVILVSLAALHQSQNSSGSSNSGAGRNLVTGILLCVVAQVFQASMFVYEEKIMSSYQGVAPMQVVGMEGACGIMISIVLLTCMQLTGHENTFGAIHQIRSSPALGMSIVGSAVAVALFNFAGATVTKMSSSVARTTIKISSTITIWIAELAFGWNTFSPLQLVGFIFVALGTVIYNRILVLPCFDRAEEEALIAKKLEPGA